MNKLVKIYKGVDGEEINDNVWCLVDPGDPVDERVLCSGTALDDGEVKYKEKHTKRGGITCPYCLERIKKYKEVKL